MEHVVHLDCSLVHKVGRVELVVVVQANDPLGNTVHVGLVGHVVGISTVENLAVFWFKKAITYIRQKGGWMALKNHLGDALANILLPPLHLSLECIFHHAPTNGNVSTRNKDNKGQSWFVAKHLSRL